ncbi:hypothetical protein [Staphylococcus pseudoxylosus]|uniref:hypothetical protein n=1 Tax=Staphylococcus pseudoxylosus TaxID=2282419 RepID=UPI002DBDC1DC|nr:hypothetical protein [Staphylococcus pseudoxylosus]MEB7752237.1 hypothetical protein [Staphylococcus pseudoxylosus]
MSGLTEFGECIYKLTEIKQERDQFHAERDNCLKDIDQLRERNRELERENRDLKHENKALRIQSNTYFDEWQEAEKQRSEFNLYVNLYATLTNHIRTKAECNPGVDRYIALVNYIDRLERD